MLQNEIQNSSRVEVTRVKGRAAAFSQNKFVGLNKIIDAAWYSTRHHWYPDVEDHIQPPDTKICDNFKIRRIECGQICERSIVLESDARFIDVTLREVFGVDPFWGFVDSRYFNFLHETTHAWSVFYDEHNFAIGVSIGWRHKKVFWGDGSPKK